MLLALTSKGAGVLAVVSLITFISCMSSTGVHHVLPDGYVGMFKIVLDETGGVEISPKDGRYVYEIPASGILKVKSFAPFRPWHDESAAYRDGTKIKLWDSKVPDDAVVLRSLGESTRGSGPQS